MIDMLNFYSADKQYTGEVKYLEKYLSAYKKGRKDLDALLEKNFHRKLNGEIIQRVKNGEEVKLEK